MVSLVAVSPANVTLFKDVRLRALQDTPLAFGSTYEQEVEIPDSEWLRRAARWSGETGIGFLAIEESVPCGIAGGFLNQLDPSQANLVSMWVTPTHRNRGIGRLLVDAVSAWARSRHARTLLLMVTSINESAILFYERLGFARTGHSEPYPNDPAILEYQMSRSVGVGPVP